MPGISIETLARVALFEDLDESELVLVADSLSERSFEPTEVVITEGGPADGFFVIESGEGEVTAQGQPLATLMAGEYFGETALLMGSERTATITAMSELRCYCLSPAQFRVIVERNPTIAWKVTQSMVDRIA